MNTHRLTLAALTVLPLVVACGAQKADSSSVGAGPSVKGVHWSVDSLTADGRTSEAPAGAYLRIDDNGRTSGDLGCNTFGGEASVTGDRVSFGRLESTGMACDDTPTDFERRLSATLGAGPLALKGTGDRLTLTTDDGDRVHLTKEPDAPLRGTAWTVTALGADGTATAVPAKTGARLTFDTKAAKVSGSLGCNKVTAGATVRDGHITLGRPSTTRMMCDTSLMKTEKALLRLFDGRVDYRIDHRTLTLTSKNGETVDAVAASEIH
ncbi:META domain-containing protein [Streptomyces griseoviridis]|uniref:META domain-containing protein n=2 Tax=Streptomyces TaxID=1883 RepID=A0A3Q9KUJ1_STRGD|nr:MULTISPECIES: META domain-containing protein [Streptomyces]AZS86320.1 META domain-containing protein [Streptomyces griseoviridis]MDH6700812.1 heat shock protein HslJ [Streptomyces sp. MAA16]MDT0476872.1 META domain-containing protein [Streptomyces sp. DSM 41014]QCN86816.1 META domain-containing protein [Streptomyces griseoviridis]